MERLTGKKIINLHIDVGGEWISLEARAHFRNRGIEVMFTQTYSPEMNGIAERMFRTIFEHASAMLWHAKLPIGFWYVAARTAVFLYNCSPSAPLGGVTPFEAMFAHKPNLGHLRVFGCRTAAHVPAEIRDKTSWSSKSTDCIFVGYSKTENLFNLWDVKKGDLVKKRDVIFWEHQMGHAALSQWALPHGVSIFPGVARNMVEAYATTPPVVQENTNAVPLLPLPARQSVQTLPPEGQDNGLKIVQFVPEVEIPKKAVVQLPRPVLINEQLANYTELMDETSEGQLCDALMSTNCYNMEDEGSQVLGETLVLPDITLPNGFHQAMRHPRAKGWKIAMEKQLASLKENNTWDLVDLPPGGRAFPNKWVFAFIVGPKLAGILDAKGGLTVDEKEAIKTMTESGDQLMEKARLVARGDLQRPGLDFDETFAPVVKFVSLRILLTYASLRKWKVDHWDIVSAFLHGVIDTDIYMKQPQGFEDGTNRVCKLNKAIYGLCQAARKFYLVLDGIMEGIGYHRLAGDWAIWIGPNGSLVAAHVDDMAITADDNEIIRIRQHVEKTLKIKDLGQIGLYVGMKIKRESGIFYLSQGDYARKILSEFGLLNAYSVTTPMQEGDREKWDKEDSELLDEKGKTKFQAGIGSLLYLMHGTRPDLAYTVIRLSQYSARPRKVHMEGLKRILRYVRGTMDANLALGRLSDVDLVGYFDAAHADTSSRKSTCGYVFLLYGSLIAWLSKVQRTVALSTTEAEYMAGTEATREAVWIKGITDAIFGTIPIVWPILLKGDNQGSLALAQNPTYHQRTKHIEIRERFITDMVQKNIIKVAYIPTREMLADSLTKHIHKDLFVEHWEKMNLFLWGMKAKEYSEAVAHTAFITSLIGSLVRKRKLECSCCGNLFSDVSALKKHARKKTQTDFD